MKKQFPGKPGGCGPVGRGEKITMLMREVLKTVARRDGRPVTGKGPWQVEIGPRQWTGGADGKGNWHNTWYQFLVLRGSTDYRRFLKTADGLRLEAVD